MVAFWFYRCYTTYVEQKGVDVEGACHFCKTPTSSSQKNARGALHSTRATSCGHYPAEQTISLAIPYILLDSAYGTNLVPLADHRSHQTFHIP